MTIYKPSNGVRVLKIPFSLGEQTRTKASTRCARAPFRGAAHVDARTIPRAETKETNTLDPDVVRCGAIRRARAWTSGSVGH